MLNSVWQCKYIYKQAEYVRLKRKNKKNSHIQSSSNVWFGMKNAGVSVNGVS